MTDVESRPYQILANILLVIGAILTIIGGIVLDRDESTMTLLIVVFIVLVAIGTRFSRVCLLLLALADVAVFVRFFG